MEEKKEESGSKLINTGESANDDDAKLEINRHDFTKCIFSWQATDSLVRAIMIKQASYNRQVLICASDPFQMLQAVGLEEEQTKD